MNPEIDSQPFPAVRGSFPMTHWSVVLQADAGSESQARAALVPLVWRPGPAEGFAAPAEKLAMNVHAFTVALQRLRRRLGDRLRARSARPTFGLHHWLGGQI